MKLTAMFARDDRCVSGKSKMWEIRGGREIMRGGRGGSLILVWSRSAHFKHCV